jgi:LPS O-antigen subunit length determinant protein (WzzB/FepE family)
MNASNQNNIEEEIEMNMEQKLACLQKAIEMGADIQISFHDIREKQEAVETAGVFSELLGNPVISKRSQERKTLGWFNVDNYEEQIRMTAFYDIEEEEVTA